MVSRPSTPPTEICRCGEHTLDQTGTKHTIIGSQLTRFMLVHVCGHYEIEIARIVSKG